MADDLNGLGDFDATDIDEAVKIADRLGQVSLAPTVRSEEAKNAKLLRDQLVSLLWNRVREAVVGALDSMTLAELAQPRPKHPVHPDVLIQSIRPLSERSSEEPIARP